MKIPASVRIVEVGPRDGLQNETRVLPVDVKVKLIESLVEAGLKTVECGSFVSGERVPQMADSGAVFAQLRRLRGVFYPVLVPNLKGLEAALQVGVEDASVFVAASETFSRRNINSSIAESLQRVKAVAEVALARGVRLRGYLSCTLGCPYEGAVPLFTVARVAQQLHELGCYEISLGDTIGVGTPLQAQAMIQAVAERIPITQLAVHFHDTWGQALANVFASLELGVAVLDASVAGLGGCPYAEGATGNLATEDLVYMLHGMGIPTGVDIDKLAAVGQMISQQLGRRTESKAALAMQARQTTCDT